MAIQPDTDQAHRSGCVRPSAPFDRRSWRAMAAALGVLSMALGAVSCAPDAPAKTVDVSSIVIGQSTRADVFSKLGKPARTEERGTGETWVYETRSGGGMRRGLMSGAAAASGVVGAFVPFVGLVGPGIGLLDATTGAPGAAPEVSSLSIVYGDDGIVRDCVYSTTGVPAGMPGSDPAKAKAAGCARPAGASDSRG